MIKIDDKEYRNLQEQVGKNQEDIKLLKFGLNIKGRVDNVPELPASAAIGDTYMVGREAPYFFYIKSAAKTWDNLGKLESNVPGPRGTAGETGKEGVGVLDMNIDMDGVLHVTYTDGNTKAIAKVTGDVGPMGLRGPKGEIGPKGNPGPTGPMGNPFKIIAKVESETALPVPPANFTDAYLVKNLESYHLWLWVSNEWVDMGEVAQTSVIYGTTKSTCFEGDRGKALEDRLDNLKVGPNQIEAFAIKEYITDSVNWTEGKYIYNGKIDNAEGWSLSDYIFTPAGVYTITSDIDFPGAIYTVNKVYQYNMPRMETYNQFKVKTITFTEDHYIRFNRQSKSPRYSILGPDPDGKKVLNWLDFKDNSISPYKLLKKLPSNNMIFQYATDSEFIPNRLWMMDRSLYTASAEWGCFEVPVTPGEVLRLYPMTKKGKVSTTQIANGAFVNKSNKLIEIIGDFKESDTGEYMTIIAPNNAAALQVNCLTDHITSDSTYNAFADIKVAFLSDKVHFDWQDIKSNDIDDMQLREIKDRLDILSGDDIPLKYGDSINKTFDFKGKYVAGFGDSITQGIMSPGLQNKPSKQALKLFCDQVGAAAYYNNGVSGTTITAVDAAMSAKDSIYQKVIDFCNKSTTSNAIFIAGGVNDYWQEIPLGTYGSTDIKTFYGALWEMSRQLQFNKPNVEVYFITPIGVGEDVHGVPADMLNAYRNAIYEVATTFGHNVINGLDLLPIQQTKGGFNNVMTDDTDGVHPTETGNEIYATNLAMKLL